MGPADPELDFFKRRYRGEFERALEEILAKLGDRERVLMRLSLVNQVSVENIGKMYGVSQSTASRWLGQAREQMADELRKVLGERLKVPASELNSLAGLVASQLDLSLSRLLRAP